MNFKFSIYQLISLIFVIIGLSLVAVTIRVGFDAYQKFLVIDENGVVSSGVMLQEDSLKKAISYLESEEKDLEIYKSEAVSESTNSGQAKIMPKIVELWYSEGVETELLDQIKQYFDQEGIEIREEIKTDIEENQIIYKESFNQVKEEILSMISNKNMEVKVLRRKEDKEVDISIRLIK